MKTANDSNLMSVNAANFLRKKKKKVKQNGFLNH